MSSHEMSTPKMSSPMMSSEISFSSTLADSEENTSPTPKLKRKPIPSIDLDHIPASKTEYTAINSSTPRPSPPTTDYRPRNSHPSRSLNLDEISSSWVIEILCLIFAACAIGAIIGLLLHYDGQRLPSWSMVSLNSLVAWLDSAAGVTILYAAKETVAQLKWVWFAQEPRKLADMKAFAEADGVLGAAELVYHMRASHFVTLASVAMVLAVGMSPFTQNLIELYDGKIVDIHQTATTTSGNWYNATGPQFQANLYRTNPVMKANVNTAVTYLGQSNSANVPNTICTTGNCTFPVFATFGYCAECTDLSDKIVKVCREQNCDVTLPNNFTALFSTYGSYGEYAKSTALGSPDAMVYKNATPSGHHFPNVFQSLRGNVNMSLVASGAIPFTNDSTFSAYECALIPCVRSINASVQSGVYKEIVLDTFTKTEAPGDADVSLTPPWGPEKGIKEDGEKTFGITYSVLQGLVSDSFPERAIIGNVTAEDGASGVGFTNDAVQSIFYADLSNSTCPFNHSDPFPCAISAVADAFTKTIRDAGSLANPKSPKNLVVGHTLVTTTFVRVRWYWITLHLVVWLLAAMGWLGTVWKTKRAGVPFWRGDPLPLIYLYHEALSTQEQEQEQASPGLGFRYDAELESVKMRLRNDDGCLRLVRE